MAKMANSTYFSCWKKMSTSNWWKKQKKHALSLEICLKCTNLSIFMIFMIFFIWVYAVCIGICSRCVSALSSFPLCFNVTLTHTQVVISHLFWLRKIHMRAIIASPLHTHTHQKKWSFISILRCKHLSVTAWAA